jgi:GTP pyrophosphokinase
MVAVQHRFSNSSGETGSIQPWLDSLAAAYAPAEIAVMCRACELAAPLYANRVELTGAPLLSHALGAASILVGMKMDFETITATILHAVPLYMNHWAETLRRDFGASITGLVEGISRMEQIQQFSEMQRTHEQDKKKGDYLQQIESLRKMLLAMVQDIRVVLIKLAERTQTLRGLSNASEEQQKLVARETRSIFAPLANRLGVWQLKWELEDLSLRYLEPQLYRKIAGLLDERRLDREQYIANFIMHLKQALEREGIKAEVTGRPKHIYSIINKMQRKQVDFSELYDVRAVRILVSDVHDCYAALGLVHSLWLPVPGEYDDYIAHPKSNDYRSLHTAVIGPRNLAVEVQIRTVEMHQHSELGVAAHWRYKEGSPKSDVRFNEKIAWLRQILEWREEVADRGEMTEQFRNELFHDNVYVLTPQGKVIDLPKGATPLDFAYTLHTDLGHRTRGAKVNGSIVPLNYKLQNAQRVEILAAKQGAPSRDWLNLSLGYVQTARARAKLRHWFKYQNFEEDISRGRVQLEREFNRLGVTSIKQEKIAQKLNFHKLDDLLAAIGRNDISDYQIAQAVHDIAPAKAVPARFVPRTAAALPAENILIEGVGNLLTSLAKCCRAAPPDPIVGYVTRNRGVTIHHQACPLLLRLPAARHDRLLRAQWQNQQEAGTAPS